MVRNGLPYTGTDNVYTTTIANATDIGMPSSGSSGEAEVILIILMLTVLPIVLPQMMEFMEFIFATVHEMSFPLGKTWTTVETDEILLHLWIIHLPMKKQWKRLREVKLTMELKINSGNISSWIPKTKKYLIEDRTMF
ncbi:uncharacterized protein LOC111111103 isoform X1 [Crassostrea virginica]